MGEKSPQADHPRERADDYVRGIGDQIEMVQYIRSRVGEDRDTVLNMGRVPDYDTRKWMPSGLSIGKGKGQSEDAASKCTMEPASKRARMTDAQAQCSPSTVTSGSGFAPLTPMSDRGAARTARAAASTRP